MTQKLWLCLAYPGTGARDLQRAIQPSTFLDSLGYRQPPGNYWKWEISIPVLRSRIVDAILRGDDHLFVGWGANWRDVVRVFTSKRPEDTLDNIPVVVHAPSVEEYRQIVENFRASKGYEWDLKLIRESRKYQSLGFPLPAGDFDYPVEWYVTNYQRWVKDAVDFVARRQPDVKGDDLSKEFASWVESHVIKTCPLFDHVQDQHLCRSAANESKRCGYSFNDWMSCPLHGKPVG